MAAAIQNPFSEPLQELSIKCIDVNRLEKAYRSEKKISHDIPIPPLEELIKFIVSQYNSEHPQSDEPSSFREISIPPDNWKKIDTKGFSFLVYQAHFSAPNPISKMLQSLDAETKPHQETSYLFLLFRTHKKSQEVFALSSNQGYRPVLPYSDYVFPRKIAFRLLDPTDPSKGSSKHIIGSVIASTEIMRSKVLFDPNIAQKIYTEFTACLRRDASLHQFVYFRTKGGEVPKRTTELNIKQGLIRIHKKLPFEAFPLILDHFSTIQRGEKTYLYQKTPSRRKKEEKAPEENFAFLEYYTPVSAQFHSYLETHLLKELASAMKKHKKPDWTLAHPHVTDYFRANEFRIRYCIGTGAPIIIEWEGYRKTFAQMLEDLNMIPHLRIPTCALEDELKNVYLEFRRGGEWDSKVFSACLIGQIQYKVADAYIPYFKLNQKWYEISSSLLSKVDEEFKKMMLACLLQESDEGFLPHPWQATPLDLDDDKIAKDLKIKKEKVEKLCNTNVVYVTEKGAVLHSTLEGEILSHPIISHHKMAIQEILSRSPINKEEIEKKIERKDFAQVVWEELTKQRKVAIRQTVIRKKIKKEIIVIRNPFLPKDYPHQKILSHLRKWANTELYTVREGKYNESYLYTVKNNHKPYLIEDCGWLVGDRICPGGIELFDILHYTQDSLYLYHVKEGFGQKTRDACSQILNSSRVLSNASNEKDSFLKKFHKEATTLPKQKGAEYTYLKTLRKQIKALGGLEGLRNLFRKKNIVFVYAFTDDRVSNHTITKNSLEKEQFTESDFVSEKTQNVASKIFGELKALGFLTSEGKKGPNFSRLYQKETLKFQDPGLQDHIEFIWHTLCGDLSFFTSLIGRMDLLHARFQVEGSGFGFKICQIPRPEDVDMTNSMPETMIWEKLDEENTQLLEKQNPYLSYWSPSSQEMELWIKKDTKADGSCAFHALLGTEQNGVYCCDPIEERKLFAEALKEDLNPTKDGFEDATLQKLYENNLKSLVEEATRPNGDLNNPIYRCAKQVFHQQGQDKHLPAFEKYLDENSSSSQIAILKEIIERKEVTAKCNLVLKLRKCAESTLSGEKFLEEIKKDEIKLHNAFVKGLAGLEKLPKTPTYKRLREGLRKFKEKTKLKEKSKVALLKDPSIMTNFLLCLETADYWLSDDELQMLGHIHNLRVEIMREDGNSNEYGCNNQHSLPPLAQDARPRVVIHGDSCHYSRCEKMHEPNPD